MSLAPNGTTIREFERDGHLISEVEFTIGDPGEYPRAIGYMVGKNDGRSVLHPSVEEAIAAVSPRQQDAAPTPAAPSPLTP